MCGPSKALQDINKNIQSLAVTMKDEAKTVFSTATTAVNKILGSVNSIIDAGASQMGFSQTELNAKNAVAINAGAAEARNLKAAAGSAVASIGGGNSVMPSGTANDILIGATQKAAEDTATAENRVTQEGFERGNQNYWRAIGAEESAPGVLGVASQFNDSAMRGEEQAMTSQKSIDQANNWWKDDIMKLGSAAVGFATGGFGSMMTGGTFSEGAGNAMMASSKGGKG